MELQKGMFNDVVKGSNYPRHTSLQDRGTKLWKLSLLHFCNQTNQFQAKPLALQCSRHILAISTHDFGTKYAPNKVENKPILLARLGVDLLCSLEKQKISSHAWCPWEHDLWSAAAPGCRSAAESFYVSGKEVSRSSELSSAECNFRPWW